ncbi:MAG: SET domain-containing protein-lysine N-methyltransferase [Chloroflexota bacterium]|nr:SET domain-containing protein-lysine N-methyltransferase [Chloroflexota bacterium]
MERPIPLSWLDPRVAIHPSSIEGRGLFVRDAIREGEVVEVWGGIRITDNELDTIARRMRKYNSAAIGEGDNVLLDLDDPIGFGNHSCDPNLWMGDATTVVARRDIASNEELTIDYATHTVSSSWRMICQCGSPHCRHIVTGDDWQRVELQARYQGHFSPFINERIRVMRAGT